MNGRKVKVIQNERMRRAVAFWEVVPVLAACLLMLAAETARSQAVEPDPRMEQKVTYTIGYARLHDVIGDLRGKTGVSIECGESPREWNVRDIPVFVYVKDMPLGKLLESVADAAHVQYVRRTSSADRQPAYRLYRTAELKKQIDGQVEDRLKAGMDFAKWAWDAMAAYGSSPDSVSVESPTSSMMTPELARAAGRIFASLAPDDKDKVFATGQIKLRARDFPQAPLIQGFCRLAWDEVRRQQRMAADASMPNLDDACLIINVYQAKAIGYTGFVLYAAYPPVTVQENTSSTTFTPTWTGDVTSQAAALANVKALKLPPKPDYDPSKPLADPLPGGDLKPIANDADWKTPLLQAAAKVKSPADVADWKCSDVLAAVAETAHINIVCEDLRSHKVPDASGLQFDFASCATVGDVLRRMGGYKWFADDGSKLLMGWDQGWRFRQKTLVEQAILDRLKVKLNGSGVELDDYVATVWLSVGQCDAWLSRTRDLGELGGQFGDGAALWKLYDMLSPDQKRLAKSDNGLPLSLVDSKWLSGLLSDDLAKAERGAVTLSAADEPADVTRRRAVFADQAVLSTAVLTVWQKKRDPGTPATTITVGGQSVAWDEPWIVELKGMQGGKEFAVQSEIPLTFPIRHGAANAKHAAEVTIETHIRGNK